MTNKREEAAQLAAAALNADGAVPRHERRPRVAMHKVTDFTGELDRTEHERDEALARLALHEGALPTRKLDPRDVKHSRFANRIEDSFEGRAFDAFKQEIASAGGNVQPIKVRRTQEGVYEIVYGHRRHRACLELGLEVLAFVQDGMSDLTLFEEMSHENEHRKDLTAYELALHYKRAVDLKLYKNWAALAAALGKTKALVSRYSALAELPRAVVDAFPSPNDIQPKWAAKLRQVIDGDKDAVLQVAKSVKGRGLSAKAVFEALINQAPKEFTRVNFSFGDWTESSNRVSIDIDKSALSAPELRGLKDYLGTLGSK